MNKSKTKLKPSPIFGNAHPKCGRWGPGLAEVECKRCKVGISRKTLVKAMRAWNRRPTKRAGKGGGK